MTIPGTFTQALLKIYAVDVNINGSITMSLNIEIHADNVNIGSAAKISTLGTAIGGIGNIYFMI